MNLELEGKSFLVGGGSKGLGRAVAGQLVAEGARVLLVSRDANALRTAADELGERASFHLADLSRGVEIEAVAAAARESFGELDGILVNGGGPPAGNALELDDEQWLQAYQMLIGGPLHLLRALVPRVRDGGAVLFVASSSVRQPIERLDTSNVLRPVLGRVAAFLLSPAASYVSGITVQVDGALVTAVP